MTSLSIIRNRPPAVQIANPIFLISMDQEIRSGAEIIFEVLEKDATALHPLIGQVMHYVLDGSTFWAKLREVTARTSTHPALALLRGEPTLWGVLAVFEEHSSKH